MKCRLEFYSETDGEQVVPLDGLDTKQARNRARSMSAKDGHLGPGVGQSVYLIGSDENGDDQENYNYFAGALVEKDLTKDWS